MEYVYFNYLGGGYRAHVAANGYVVVERAPIGKIDWTVTSSLSVHIEAKRVIALMNS